MKPKGSDQPHSLDRPAAEPEYIELPLDWVVRLFVAHTTDSAFTLAVELWVHHWKSGGYEARITDRELRQDPARARAFYELKKLSLISLKTDRPDSYRVRLLPSELGE